MPISLFTTCDTRLVHIIA